MAVDERKYAAEGAFVFGWAEGLRVEVVAHAESRRKAKLIANALNLYRPKVRVRKMRAEKSK